MSIAIVTGSFGLVGAATCRLLAEKGLKVIGIDNDMRQQFFGEEASTRWMRNSLENDISGYQHHDLDIRNAAEIETLFEGFGTQISAVVHTAAQPSHDWAASDPVTDFTVNANGTLILLEAARKYAPEAAFIHCSTNKVYGDLSNHLPLVEQDRRWELDPSHPYATHGIDEAFSIDQSQHSLFGVSKAASDLMVQEYGRYFGMNTACFRAGCITGADHSGAQLHGFLAYLMRCVMTGKPYTVFGYKGKQVRDNIHGRDLANAFWHYIQAPSRPGAVYNIGGSRHANCSMLEAIDLCQEQAGRKLKWSYSDENRAGDHIWWISDIRRFRADYPDWDYRFDLKDTLAEMHEAQLGRLAAGEE